MILPFKRIETGAVATYTLYGKLPNRADFVRVNATHPVAMEFDAEIQCAFEHLTSETHWEQTYDAGNAVNFQYVSRDLRYTLIGVLKPSGDQAGRRYPLVAGAILPSESITGYAHLAPIAYEVFFDGLREQVSTAIENSVEALSCRQFLESQMRNGDTAVADLELARSIVGRFMNTTSIKKLSDLRIVDMCPGTLEQTLLNLVFYRAFLRRFDNPATNQIIVLPLSGNQGEQALIACAWLSMLDALWGENTPVPCSYLLLNQPSGTVVLAACFGKIHAKFATIMLGGALHSSALLNLDSEQEAWKNHRLYAEVSYALGRFLADPALPLSTLREFLQDVGQKLKEPV